MAYSEQIQNFISDTLNTSPATTTTPTGVATAAAQAEQNALQAQEAAAAEEAAYMEARQQRLDTQNIVNAVNPMAGITPASTGPVVKPKPYVDLGESTPATFPSVEDSVYVKSKYTPVEPRPYRMFDGSEYTTDTSNAQKAMYQFITGVKGVKGLDWVGYNIIGPKEEESWMQGLVRSAVNSVPQIAISALQGVGLAANDAANAMDLLFSSDEKSKKINEVYNANAAMINEYANQALQSLRIDYTDITERDTKESALIWGNLVGSVAPAILGGPAAVTALSMSEGLSGYAGIRNALRDSGYDPMSAAGMALGGGLAIGGLSAASNLFVADVQKVLQKTGSSLIKEAMTNPKNLQKIVSSVGLKKALVEAGTEVMQEDVQRLMSGESLKGHWDERLNVAVASLLFGAGAAYYQASRVPSNAAKTKEYVTKVTELIEGGNEIWGKLVEEGVVSKESMDAILAAIKNPDSGAAVASIIKDSIIQQFDKVHPDQVKRMQKVLSGLDAGVELDKEFAVLNQNIDALLKDSGLSTAQQSTARAFLQGIAAWQLTTMGVLPSQMQLPGKVTTTRPANVQEGAGGWTADDGSVIYVSTGNESTAVGNTSVVAQKGRSNAAISSRVGADISAAAKTSESTNLNRSLDVANTLHEFTHWAERNTKLKNVKQFTDALSKVVSTIIPDYTKGKTGVELSEAFAYGIQYAGEQVKEALGVTGPVQDYVNFLNSMLTAQKRSGTLTAEMKTYFETLQNVMKANAKLVDQILEEWETPEALRGAIKEFIRTGNPGALSVDTLRALSAVMNSVIGRETQDKLSTVFESKEQMQEFKDAIDTTKAKDTEKKRAEAAEKTQKNRAKADEIVGLDKKTTVQATQTDVLDDIASGEPEESVEVRLNSKGEPLDTDATKADIISNERLLKYEDILGKWLTLQTTTPVGEGFVVGDIVETGEERSSQKVIDRKIAAIKGYQKDVADLKAKRKAEGRTDGLYAIVEILPVYTTDVSDAMADLIAETETGRAEQDFYKMLAVYERDSNNVYIDYEVTAQLDGAALRLMHANSLLEDLDSLVIQPNSPAFDYAKKIKRRALKSIQFYEQRIADIMSAEAMTADGIGIMDMAGTTDDRTKAQKEYDAEMGKAEALKKEAAEYEAKGDEISAFNAIDLRAKAEQIIEYANKRLEASKKKKTATSRTSSFFAPFRDSELADRLVGVDTVDAARAFLKRGEGTAEDIEGAKNVATENSKYADYSNPVNWFENRPLLDTPSPLEVLGVTEAEAVEQIEADGLQPYELNVDAITSEYIGRGFNTSESIPATRLRIYNKLTEHLTTEEAGIRNIAKTGSEAERMRVLLAVHQARNIANAMFNEYISREQSFAKHPTLGNGITQSAVDFIKSERGTEQLKDHIENRGYSEPVLAHDLEVLDEVAFAYGSNMFRGIVSGKFNTGQAQFYTIRRDINLEDWKSKELTNSTRGLDDLVLAAEDFHKVGVLRRPIESMNPERSQKIFEFYDHAYEAMGRSHKNYTLIAYQSIIEGAGWDEPVQMTFDFKNGHKMSARDAAAMSYRNSRNVREHLHQEGLYSAAPVVDSGVFAVIGGGLEDAMATQARASELEQEYAESGAWYEGKLEADALAAEEIARRQEQVKPKFSDAIRKKNENGVSFLDQLDMLTQGLKETRVNKSLYFLGSGSGTDRKGRLLFGKVWDKAFGLSKAYSYGQQVREGAIQDLDAHVIESVFKGSRIEYDKWRSQLKADKFKAVVNGVEVSISRDEIMSIYAMKRAERITNGANTQYKRLRKYGNLDELIGHLTEQDKAFVDKVAISAIVENRTDVSVLPRDWVPSVEMNAFIKEGWDGRRRVKADNSLGLVESDSNLAALGLYESVISEISRWATKRSGLMVQLDSLQKMLSFAGVDKSLYREFDGDDMAAYDDILARSVALREEISKKIGATQARWLIKGIEYDLQADPLADDIRNAPGTTWFQRLTRGAASSALSLNFRQAVQNLGNYHRFFGLSKSGAVKFYSADWIHAVANIKEAWNLAMENPEFKRRFEQAGLSEHMRRIADVKEESFLTDIQKKLYEKGKEGASDMVSKINSLSTVATKWGLSTNVIPDMVGIALGNYVVYQDVLAKNGGNVAATQKEIADFVNNRVSSSNYMTQSLLKKTLNKWGLGALVMFQSDQLQSFGALAEAWSTLMNSTDAETRSQAKKDITSFLVSTARYIAIKAGWIGALMAVASGKDLSDEEWDYIYDSTAFEAISQLGGWSQFNNLGISPFLRSVIEGEKFGPSIVTTSSVGRLISGTRKGFKGDASGFAQAFGESMALSGVAPYFPSALRIADGIFNLASDDENRREVGALQVIGDSKKKAMDRLGLSESKKTGQIKPKKKLKKNEE